MTVYPSRLGDWLFFDMDLLEYQAKELFRRKGIPVLPSQQIDRPQDLKGLQIPYPVVLKSQVPMGGRGRAGGIRFVENTIDAVAAAQIIFNLPIAGRYPSILLAESKFNAQQEFYLAVVLDYEVQRPVLLGSQQGGEQVESAEPRIHRVVVNEEFSPFYARRLVLQMGLAGSMIQAVSQIIEKMAQLFFRYDLDLIEINPLGVNPAGEMMALDGKIAANDAAIGRHPRLTSLLRQLQALPSRAPTSKEQSFADRTMTLDGNLGLMSNGAELTMALADVVTQVGGAPAVCLNVGEECEIATSGLQAPQHNAELSHYAQAFCDRIIQGIGYLSQQNSVKAILIDLACNVVSCKAVAQAIVTYLHPNEESTARPMTATRRADSSPSGLRTIATEYRSPQTQKRPRSQPKKTTSVKKASRDRPANGFPPLAIRLTGFDQAAAKEQLSAAGIPYYATLEEAAKQTASLIEGAEVA